MSVQLLVGDILVGFGCFRHLSDEKRVEAVGADWVVARDDGGTVDFMSGESIHKELAPLCKRFGARWHDEAGGSEVVLGKVPS